MIAARPSSSLIDKIVKITVAGLKPRQRITLQASLVGDRGEVFESHAHYNADEDNMVDVCRQPSVGGSYTGDESMGLLWSMKAAPGQRKGLMLRKVDVTKPYNIVLNCFDGHLSPPLEGSLQPLSSVTFKKWYMADGVKRIPVKEGRIRGTLFLPAGEGPFPGIIDLLGGAGGLLEFKASLLASHGFATLALAYFNYDDLPSDPAYVELEYFEEAVEWLIQHPKVLSHGIGMQSNCLGTWIALLLASYRSDLLKAVVAISPWHGAYWKPYKYRGKLSKSYSPNAESVIATNEGNINRYSYSPDQVVEVNHPSSELPAVTPVENISCPVLLVFGTNDLNIDSDFSVDYISQQMKKAGNEDLCSVLRLPDAGHLIEPPYTPLSYASYFKLFAVNFVWGGETKAHALGQEVAWERILDFFHQKLVRNIKSNL